MSDSSQDFDRSQLERKDREQLVVIATTLGKKPPSRARKAEIVDLILELAGVTTGGDSASDPADAADPVAPESEVAAKAAPSSRDASDVASASASTDAPSDDRNTNVSGPTATSGTAPRNDRPNAGATRRDNAASNGAAKSAQADGNGPSGGSRNGNGNGQNNAGGQDNRGANNGVQSKGQGQGQESRGQSAGGRDNSGQGDAQSDGLNDGQGEGARRRRRRGRGAGGQGQGQGGQSQGGQGQGLSDGQNEPEPIDVEGILDLRDDGYGFLRLRGYLAHRDDSYVSVKQVRQFGLRKGDRIKGLSRPPTRSEKNPALLRIDEVNGADPHLARERPDFAELTPEYPSDPLRLEHRDTIVDMTPRIIDLVAPIGKGQRGLIVAPPKSGKTTILKTIARAVEQNHPETHLMVLLIDERPEEVTDFERWIQSGEVVSSTFDRPSEEHTIVAELAIERAKRIAESGGDVVVLVDGITRLTRAYNLTVKESGRLMSGGIDAAAIWPAKRFFGAARKLAEGGSLTILATALVDTNSRMDDHIFEEFKGTGNAELRLDRRLAESRIFPAIDVAGSGTRHEELLFTKPEQVRIAKLRRVLAGVPDDAGNPGGAMSLLIERLQAFKSNEDFLAEVAKS